MQKSACVIQKQRTGRRREGVEKASSRRRIGDAHDNVQRAAPQPRIANIHNHAHATLHTCPNNATWVARASGGDYGVITVQSCMMGGCVEGVS